MLRLGDNRQLAIRGAFLLIHGIKFQGDNRRHSKFGVLMEGYARHKYDYIVALGTSSLEYHHVPTTFLIPGGTFPEHDELTLIHLENRKILTRGQLLSRQCVYVGQLPTTLISQMDDALERLWVGEATWLRMCG